MKKRETIKTDVLIVGGGIAGAFAAIRAAEFGRKVTLVEPIYLNKECSKSNNYLSKRCIVLDQQLLAKVFGLR